jgi:hypothetical protein
MTANGLLDARSCKVASLAWLADLMERRIRVANAYIKPEDVDPSDAATVLDFLNAVVSAKELAEAIEIPGKRDIGTKLAQRIFNRRQELGTFRNLRQVADIEQLGPKRFTELVNALLEGAVRRKPELSDENLRTTALATSIIEAARILKQGITELPLATAGIPLLAAPAGLGITLKCGTKVTLYSEKEGEGSATDWPFGKSADQVKRMAMRNAETNAIQKVTEDLYRQSDLISCEDGCAKQRGPISTEITIPATITSAYEYYAFDVYYAKAQAEGTLTVGCFIERPK